MLFEKRKVYNFNTLAPSILGGSYKNMQVVALLEASETGTKAEIYTMHETLKGVITALPADVNDLNYVLFKSTTDGSKLLLAEEYIDNYTIETVSNINIEIKILDASSSDIAIATTALKEVGLSNLVISTTSIT